MAARYAPPVSADTDLLLASSRRVPRWLRLLIAPAGTFRPLMRAIEELPANEGAARFASAALDRFGVSYRLPQSQLANMPPSGAVIVVANHPFGAIDGLIAIATLAARRPDLKILAHGMLANVPALAGTVLPINPFGGRAAARGNAPSIRAALRHLASGGMVLTFPAGEVSHYSLHRLSISDPPWLATTGRIVQLSGAPVLPMHFAGRNSWQFQVGGLLHPRLRTLMLGRELLNKAGQCIDVRIGRLLAARRLAELPSAEALIQHLRATTYLLGNSDSPAGASSRPQQPLREAVPGDTLAAEVAALPDACCLASLGAFTVYVARAQAIPHVLQEIGRRREESFRAVGEGTGRSSDIDVFDDYYEQLFVWNSADSSIAGGYRIGQTDEIRRRFGQRGLYLHTLFEFREPFFRLLGPALELGRSFVSVEYQRSYAPLLLLWRGICEYVGRNPHYSRLIGPVSLSNNYDRTSRALVVRGLRLHRYDPVLGSLVRARRRFAARLSVGSLFGVPRKLPDLDTLDQLLSDHDVEGKGLPVLLRQYLKLGARTLAFNVDAAFADSIDCLITVDVKQIPPATLRRYMSADSLLRLQQHRGSGGTRQDANTG